MKTIAVIAELNPLHNGHARLFSDARAHSGADAVVVVMSGDYVQRGEPAIFNKYERARMALLSGADLVLELPVAVSCGSAQRFAAGAVALLDRLQVIDELWFGSESGNLSLFTETAALLAEEPPAFSDALRRALAEGLSFPAARARALAQLEFPEETQHLLRYPNNILGLEYCLALQRCGSRISPKTLLRTGAGYHSEGLSADGLSSAAALRACIRQHAQTLGSACGAGRPANAPSPALTPTDGSRSPLPPALQAQIPAVLHAHAAALLSAGAAVWADDFSAMLQYRLFSETRTSLTHYLDVPEELAGRILQQREQYTSFTGFCSRLKTKERTYTQISRALLHILLGITPADLQQALAPAFVRMLGFREAAAPLLTAIRQKGQLRLVSKAAVLSEYAYARDLFASRLYESVRAGKCAEPFIDDFRRPVITM